MYGNEMRNGARAVRYIVSKLYSSRSTGASKTRVLLLAGFVGLATVLASPAAAEDMLTWSRSLAGLGFRQGLTKTAAAVDVTLDFQVPQTRKAKAARLSLRYNVTLPANMQGSLDILADGRRLSTQMLAAGTSRHKTVFTIAPELLSDGVLRLELRLHNKDCAKPDAPKLALQILPYSFLAVDFPGTGYPDLHDLKAFLQERVHLAIPASSLEPHEYEFAASLAAYLERTGRTVMVEPPGEPRVARPESWIRLERGKNDADLRALITFNGRGAPEVAVRAQTLLDAFAAQPAALPAFRDDRVSIAGLGADVGTRDLRATADWIIPLTPYRLPAGFVPHKLTLVLHIPARTAHQGYLIRVFFDGDLIATQYLRPSAALSPVTIDLAAHTIGLDSAVHVSIEPMDAGLRASACKRAETPLPVTLSSESVIDFTAIARPANFAELVPLFAAGVGIRMPRDFLGRPVETLPLAIAMVRDFVPPTGRAAFDFSNQPEGNTPAEPFIFFGEHPPIAARLPLDPARGPAAIFDRKNVEIVSASDLDKATLVQLAEVKGIWGLWVKPSLLTLPRFASTTSLSRGNVALLDRNGVAFWINADAPRGLVIRHEDQGAWTAFVSRYWPWFVGSLWAALTFLLWVRVLKRIREPHA